MNALIVWLFSILLLGVYESQVGTVLGYGRLLKCIAAGAIVGLCIPLIGWTCDITLSFPFFALLVADVWGFVVVGHSCFTRD